MIYRFGGIGFEPGVGELHRDGEPERLPRLCRRLLLYLIEHPERVVSKDELCEHVWHAHSVTDDAIHAAIALLRRKLGDTGTPRRIIETCHRAGYRFIAEFEAELPRFAPACQAVLEAASVLGTRFDIHWLAELVADSPTELLRRLQPAIDAQLLAEGEEGGVWCFSNSADRDAIYGSLPAAQRLAWHLAAAEAIERDGGPTIDAELPMLAAHRFAAAPEGDLGRAVAACAGAARWATDRQQAHGEAALWWRRALRLMDLRGEANTPARRDIRIALGGALYRSGDATAARSEYLAAIREAREDGDTERFAAATLGLFEPNYQGNFTSQFEDDRRVWIGFAREAVDRLAADRDSALRARLCSRLSLQFLREHRRHEADDWGRRALHCASETSEAAAMVDVLLDQHFQRVAEGDRVQVRAQAEQALQLAEVHSDAAHRLRCHIHLLDCGVMSADAPLVEEQLDRIGSFGDLLGSYESRKVAVMEAILRGRLASAEELLAKVADELKAPDRDAKTNVPFLLQQFQIQKLRAGLAPGHDGYAHQVEQNPSNLLVRAYLAGALAERGEREAATRHLVEIHDRADEVSERRDWQVVLLEVAATAPRAEVPLVAERFYQRLSPLQGGFVLWGGGTLCCGSVDHALGSFAMLLEEWDTAESHFESATSDCEALGARPFVVAARLGWAGVLRSRGRPEDRKRADTLTRAARLEASQLGIQALP